MEFVKDDLIKINPEIFTSDDLVETFGDLGYAGLLKHLTFRVIGSKKESFGEVYECSIENKDILLGMFEGLEEVEVTGTWLILAKDSVRANMKVTLDYVIKDKPKAKKVNLDNLIAALFDERKKLRSEGKQKTSPSMMENWRKIRVARKEVLPKTQEEKEMIEVEDVSGVSTVLIPSKKLEFEVSDSILPKDSSEEEVNKFKNKLTSLLRSHRRSLRASVNEVKKLYETDIVKNGGVYVEGGQIKKAFENFLKDAFKIKKVPMSTKDNYVGLELEVVYSGNYKLLEQLMAEERLHREVTIEQDQSVRACHNTGYTGLELTVLCKEEDISRVLTKLCRVFENPDIDAYVNRSCGLHVHLDMRNRDHKKAFTNLVRVQNLLRGSQPKGRVRNLHCRPNEFDTFKHIDETGGRQDRYWVINPNAYQKFKTLEIRVHEGTIDSSNIFNWVKFLISIVEHKDIIPANDYKLASDLTSLGVKIPSDSIMYIDNRITKYKSLGA